MILLDGISSTNTDHAVYQLHDTQSGELLYIGVCRLSQLYQFPDLAHTDTIDKRRSVSMMVLSIQISRWLAEKHRKKLMHELRTVPEWNRLVKPPSRGSVICLETDGIWPTARAAALDAGVSEQYMSAYLNGRCGSKIRGKTYLREV